MAKRRKMNHLKGKHDSKAEPTISADMMKEYIHNMCVFTSCLMEGAGEDDFLDGLGIGMCVALAMLGDTDEHGCSIPFFKEDFDQVFKMLSVGAHVLDGFDDDDSIKKPVPDEPDDEDDFTPEELEYAEQDTKEAEEIIEQAITDLLSRLIVMAEDDK